jgi:hypothetical protein
MTPEVAGDVAAVATGTPVDVWIAYAVGIAGLLGIVVRAVPSVFGPLGRWVEEWTDRRQRVARHTTAAEVLELQTSVHALEDALADLRQKSREHAVWDRHVYREMLRNGLDVEPPPDLF